MPAVIPNDYAPWVTTIDTTVGHLYSELNPKVSFREYVTEKTMGGSVYEMGWTGRMPKMRPWVGARVVHSPNAQTYKAEPIPWELTYGMDQFKIGDSTLRGEGIFWRMLPDQVRQGQLQPEYEIRDLLEARGLYAGPRQVGFDGKSNFNTAHLIDVYNAGFKPANALFSSGQYSNDLRGGFVAPDGTTIGGAFGTKQFASALQYMQAIPGEDGETLGVTPDTIIHPLTLQVEAKFVLKATFLAAPEWGAFSPLTGQVGTVDNQLAKMGVRSVINSYLTRARNWFLADCSHPVAKPLFYIMRDAFRIVPRVNPDDPRVFDFHQQTWGGWQRSMAVWDFPWMMTVSGPTAGA